MTIQDPKLIEAPTRLSESKLWEIQKNYFKTMGIEAWNQEVPYYISSNSAIAFRYAVLVAAFIKDWLVQTPSNEDPFYILELGSGTGRFSFYFLRAFKKLLSSFGLQDIKFCYVISDVTEQNIIFCLENDCFTSFVKNNELDFANFNIEEDKDFSLRLKNKNYAALQLKTPLVIIANYVFDCIKQDMFEYDGDRFQEVRVGLHSRYKNFNIEKSLHLNEIRFEYQSSDIDIAKYYHEPVFKELFEEYQPIFNKNKAVITMPLGAFEFIKNMRSLTNNNFFMITGDKGVIKPEQMLFLDEKFRASYDGCYSFLVNFHAMGKFINSLGGDYLLTQFGNDFKVNLYSSNMPITAMSLTRNYFENTIDKVGADEFCYIFDEYLASDYRFAFKGLISFLRLSEWDPTAYVAIHDRLSELIGVTLNYLLDDLKNDLLKVEENIYHLKFGEDAYLLLGVIHQQLKNEDKALELYLKSIKYFGDKSLSHNSAGVIYEKKGDFPKATMHFQQSVACDKTNIFAKRKIMQLTGRPYLAFLAPLFKSVLILGLMGAALYLMSR